MNSDPICRVVMYPLFGFKKKCAQIPFLNSMHRTNSALSNEFRFVPVDVNFYYHDFYAKLKSMLFGSQHNEKKTISKKRNAKNTNEDSMYGEETIK